MKMPSIDFIFDSDCPNVAAARAGLIRALSQAGLALTWNEWRIGDPDMPQRTMGFGSPSILIDGIDVAGAAPGDAQSCRVYAQPDGTVSGLPSIEQIVGALRPPRRQRWTKHLTLLPGIGTAMLPKLACPACWPAYAGLMTSLGLGFLLDARWLLPVTAAFLVLTIAVLGYRAAQRRGYGPVGLAAAAAVLIMVGKFAMDTEAVVYTGVGLLFAAAVWNAWPRRTEQASCPACRSADT
jgi:mercuric ion transport protein